MGRTAVVATDIANGTLIEPFDIRMPTNSGYHVTSPIERADMPMVTTFRNWVLERFQPALSAA
jgi:LysR family glycine cleavage system transcriptional activator